MRIGRNPRVRHAGSIRRFAIPAIASLIALVAFALQTTSTMAAEFRTGDSPGVPANETVTGDLYLFGGDVDIDGTVRGDVIASSGSLTLTGAIEGSLSAVAGDMNIDGTVERSLRVAGGDVSITGEVGGDVVVAGGNVTIEDTATVAGDLIVAGGDVEVLGPVQGDIRGNVGSLTINSTVGGDVKVDADNIRLRSRARVAGDLDYTSRNEAKLDDGARVTGVTRQTEPARFYPGDNIGTWFASAIFRLLCALFAGVVLVLLLPRAVATVADGIRVAPASSFVLGLVLLFLVPVLVLILLVTVVGIPIALILLVAYFCTLYLSQIFLGLALGRIILPKSWDTTGRGYNLLAMALGVVIIAGLRLIPLPFISTFIATITAIFGLGAIILGPRRLRAQTATFRGPDWQWNRPQ
jgi:cytoskeletal protein CcmA (bactofilin family)